MFLILLSFCFNYDLIYCDKNGPNILRSIESDETSSEVLPPINLTHEYIDKLNTYLGYKDDPGQPLKPLHSVYAGLPMIMEQPDGNPGPYKEDVTDPSLFGIPKAVARQRLEDKPSIYRENDTYSGIYSFAKVKTTERHEHSGPYTESITYRGLNEISRFLTMERLQDKLSLYRDNDTYSNLFGFPKIFAREGPQDNSIYTGNATYLGKNELSKVFTTKRPYKKLDLYTENDDLGLNKLSKYFTMEKSQENVGLNTEKAPSRIELSKAFTTRRPNGNDISSAENSSYFDLYGIPNIFNMKSPHEIRALYTENVPNPDQNGLQETTTERSQENSDPFTENDTNRGLKEILKYFTTKRPHKRIGQKNVTYLVISTIKSDIEQNNSSENLNLEELLKLITTKRPRERKGHLSKNLTSPVISPKESDIERNPSRHLNPFGPDIASNNYKKRWLPRQNGLTSRTSAPRTKKPTPTFNHGYMFTKTTKKVTKQCNKHKHGCHRTTVTEASDGLMVESPVTVTADDGGSTMVGDVLDGHYTSAQPTRSPKQRYFDLMQELKEGYLMVFILEVSKMIYLKQDTDVKDVLGHTESIYHRLKDTGRLSWTGKALDKAISKVSMILSNFRHLDYVKSYSSMLFHMLMQRRKELSQEVNSIIDEADIMYDDEEGNRLFSALREFDKYPHRTIKTGYYICNNFIEGILSPFHRLSGTANLQRLVDKINIVLKKKFSKHVFNDTSEENYKKPFHQHKKEKHRYYVHKRAQDITQRIQPKLYQLFSNGSIYIRQNIIGDRNSKSMGSSPPSSEVTSKYLEFRAIKKQR